MEPVFLTNDRFDRSDYSRNEINLFASDFAGRLENLSNPVLSPDDRALVRSLLTAFQSALGVQATTIGRQVGGTLTRQQAGEAARAFISQQEGLVRAKFGKASAPYLEFYPQGITEYQRATVEGLRALLDRYANAATKYSPQLGDSFKNEVLAIRQQYNDARDSQTAVLGTHAGSSDQVNAARKALTVQLTRCLLLTAAGCVGNPEGFNRWFNFGLLDADNPNKPAPPASVPVPGE